MSEHGTESERYLTRLARRSFLSLWSYARPYRDQGIQARGEGAELCDLIAVFGDTVIIFSDKDCAFPTTPDRALGWSRWFRRAIWDSACQIWGAERWIRNFPARIYLDKQCTKSLPIHLPDPTKLEVHRIVVAHDTTGRRAELAGGSGTLMLNPNLHGPDAHALAESQGGHPFAIGRLDDDRGFVHVLDEVSLGVVLTTLDTAPDLVNYLRRKESFLLSGRLHGAFGEEDLLAFYLKNIGPNGEHDFVLPPQATKVLLEEGQWDNFGARPERQRQLAADRVSYYWDAMIEEVARHAVAGTLEYTNHPAISSQEVLLRRLAREPRTRRRMLARSLLEIIEQADDSGFTFRVVMPSFPGDPHYAFVIAPRETPSGHPIQPSTHDRDRRRDTVLGYSMVVMLTYPSAVGVVGIGTEGGFVNGRSHDVVYIDRADWTSDFHSRAAKIQQTTGWCTKTILSRGSEEEYPSTHGPKPPSRPGRNERCPCGSGKKFKRCHGQA